MSIYDVTIMLLSAFLIGTVGHTIIDAYQASDPWVRANAILLVFLLIVMGGLINIVFYLFT